MSRPLTALALIIAGCVAVAGLSAFPGCGYRWPAMPEAGGFPPDAEGATPKGGLKIEVPVNPPPQPLGTDTNKNGEIDRNERNAAAVGVFQDTVIEYCRWMILLVTVASVAALVLSFTPWSIMSAGKAMYGFAAVAAIMVGQLALLLWGELIANVAGILTLVSTIAAFGMLVWYVITAIQTRIEIRRKKAIEDQAAQLAAEGHAREATALLSTVNQTVNEKRSEVAQIIAGLPEMDAKTKAKALAKLKEWGVMV